MRTMEVTAKVKAAGVADGLAEGQFVALVSVFNNEDSMGDVVRPGAFTQTLQDWAAKGDSIPVIWSHQWSDPFAHIGHVLEAQETDQGLEVLGQIDDLGENDTADQVYRLLKGRRVTQFSFAYDVPNGGGAWVKDDTHPWGGYYELRQVDLHEVGPCLLGVNRETELLAAKAASIAAGAKAGRVLSQANYDRLTAAYQSIGEVLAAAEPEKARQPAAPKNDTPSEESGQPGSAAASGTEPPAQPSEPAPAQDAADTATTSSTENEATPDPREASDADAAKAGAVSNRLRTDLALLELEVSLTE
ncbi:HK97 family phage prohead protease [Streptomyces sp. NBC_00557]|uniref:HK97 family phage prohead protease n=1 Tax=Streptomyces sp. NBC_00557 TaxID=2975776 RepID=UPI002E80C397|nr:HK97 family phage prohead protease [Streptomyces sp. NBC_00557]WUC36396.1 HK97 family phage prohead protease [Streptomyces sp. NBC_00557]